MNQLRNFQGQGNHQIIMGEFKSLPEELSTATKIRLTNIMTLIMGSKPEDAIGQIIDEIVRPSEDLANLIHNVFTQGSRQLFFIFFFTFSLFIPVVAPRGFSSFIYT